MSKCFGVCVCVCVSSSQLVANAVLFVCVNCVGIFHRWMTEHDLRTSNQKREEYSAIRSQKEIKKYQQVKQRCSNASYLVFRSAWTSPSFPGGVFQLLGK